MKTRLSTGGMQLMHASQSDKEKQVESRRISQQLTYLQGATNLEYSGFLWTWNSQGILCNLREN